MRQLLAAGYEVSNGEPMEGYDHVYVNDPFGNRLELLQPVSGHLYWKIYGRNVK
jgi:hypothetical protein